MSVIRQRLPETVFDEVFRFLLGLLEKRRLLKGKALGIDATTLEANAAMKSIARQDKKVSNEDWESPNDPETRIARMKDGTTHLANKA